MSDSSARSRSDAAATRRWVERLERFAAGNHTVAAFCAAEGVSAVQLLPVAATARPTRSDAAAEPPDRRAHSRRTTSRPRDPDRTGPPVRDRRPVPRRRPPGTDRRRPPRAGGAAVLTVPPTIKLWFAAAVDLRLGFDGLANLVRTQLSADPLGRPPVRLHQSVRQPVKVLYWGGHGLCLWCQRLEAGRYHFPEATAAGIELTAAQFAMILDGIDLSRVRRFKRFLLRLRRPRATRRRERCSTGMDATTLASRRPAARRRRHAPGDGPGAARRSPASCEAENAELQAKLDAALKHRFGRRSERRTPPPVPAAEKPPPPTRRRTAARRCPNTSNAARSSTT